MLLSTLLAVALVGQSVDRQWIEGRDRKTGESGPFWGWKDTTGSHYWPHEQAEAKRNRPKFPTGVNPTKMAADTQRSRGSDQAAKEWGDAITKHVAHDAAKPCPNGPNGPCPNNPTPDDKARPPAVPVKVDWNIRPEIVGAGIAVILAVALIIKMLNEQPTE